MSRTTSASDPKDPQSGPPSPLDHLLADSEAPWTYQQTDQDDLNPKLDSHASSTSNFCFTQDSVYFEDRLLEPHGFDGQQQSLQRDSTSADIGTLCEGEQEKDGPNVEASLNSYETS
jgi:hypothetical protein